MLPEWSANLRYLYWRLRLSRTVSRPSTRTLQRRVRAEKKRLLGEGVDFFELHAVCTILRRGDHSDAGRKALQFLAKRTPECVE